ncbi:MAG: translation elongation factor 4 [bacterium]
MDQSKIRNFVIISHIDHGKSTLADRFLELTGAIEKRKMQPQFLDMMELEREKGITIKMQPVRLNYVLNGQSYVLNLIDTPGHVDFGYEVSRALAAVEGAILLVDAAQGIQAQTLANLELAQKQQLVIIPVVNKIDLSYARVEETVKELATVLGIAENEIIKISAKNNINIEEVLKAVVDKVPAPRNTEADPFRALIFDSKYDSYKGVTAFVRIVDGKINDGEKIYLLVEKANGEAKEIGFFIPDFSPQAKLSCGEIGYIATGIKQPDKVKIGDTIVLAKDFSLKPLPGYAESKPMVFISIYPADADDHQKLKESLDKIKLTDAAFMFKPEAKASLGRGFQCGFLGLLHAEILTERLRREFDLDLVLSTPSIVYKVTAGDDKEILVYTPQDFPEQSAIKGSKELWVNLQILTPQEYLSQVLELSKIISAKYVNTEWLGGKAKLILEAPLREIINRNFYDKLKSISQGYASMNYDVLDWREVCLVKLDILVLGKREDSFSQIVPQETALQEGRALVSKLKLLIPEQLFTVPLQAVVGGKVIARETVKARRKDVTAPLYGGDVTRKRKLLDKQKKGKAELKAKGKIKIPPDVYLKILS